MHWYHTSYSQPSEPDPNDRLGPHDHRWRIKLARGAVIQCRTRDEAESALEEHQRRGKKHGIVDTVKCAIHLIPLRSLDG